MHLKKQLNRLVGGDSGYWSQRLWGQVDYLLEALNDQTEYTPDVLAGVLDELTAIKNENGALTKGDVLAAEEKLSCYVPLAKQFDLRMISHAHIDMNWQWGFEETVGATIDTFRTMLRLLEEYPQFIFSQSQAAVYEIVEKYAPDLLPAIRQRVQEGRWEVIASTWVEADKNMINTESMARHILYTKNYMQQLLGLKPEQLELDFEPDTFGHSGFTPEILVEGGVRYYYHCRGFKGPDVYRWRGPSGAEVLTFKDPEWYMLIDMGYDMANHVPKFCRKNHTKSAVRFYGVGDHGGGPTRRDIERILDMQTWSLMPNITFSTLHDFYRELESSREYLPVVEQELNCVFTGCYTSQARIKQINRQGEDHLYDAEALCAMANAMGCDMSDLPAVDSAWKKVLFNQFHDILPGSGLRETREHAMGTAQEANGLCVGLANRAIHAMGQKIATNAFGVVVDPNSVSEGAGVGYNSCNSTTMERAFAPTKFNVGGVGGSSGLVRPYTFFNPTQYDREEYVEVTVWDWPEPLEATRICDAQGNESPFDVLTAGEKYWHHMYSKLGFVVKVPAFGYANYYVLEADRPAKRIPIKGNIGNGRVHDMSDAPIVLENENLRAVFDHCTMELISLTDKKTGKEMISAPSASFRLNDEQDHPRMSSWIISPVGHSEVLNRSCFVKMENDPVCGVRSSVKYEISFRSSRMEVTVSLDPGASALRYSLLVDWHERSAAGVPTPQLQFHVPFAYAADNVRYDVPGGSIVRQQVGHDVPAILYGAALPNAGGPGLVLTTDCKYGYRTYENALNVTLFHSGHTPDKQPDIGPHMIEIGLGVAHDLSSKALTEFAVNFSHPLYCFSNTSHTGELPESGQVLKVNGDARVAAVKLAEDGEKLVLRLTQDAPEAGKTEVSCGAAEGWICDILENPVKKLESTDGSICVDIAACATKTVLVDLKR